MRTFSGLTILSRTLSCPEARSADATLARKGGTLLATARPCGGGPSATAIPAKEWKTGPSTVTAAPLVTASNSTQTSVSDFAASFGYQRPPPFQSEIGPARKCPFASLSGKYFLFALGSTTTTSADRK